jgi:carbonic anhydrase/acetyltransferase-like protein (isoleucine patch superfamily)
MIKSFRGKAPRIAASAFVSEAAHVIGDVEIGENSSVWPGAVIRGDFGSIRIGRNTQIEDSSVVHADSDMVIGDSVHIGHGAVIHCSRIGNRVLVGMNATILHGAEIGDFCVIAANSLVGERKKIPEGSFVAGMPGKVRGKVSPQQAVWADLGVEYYVKLAAEYGRLGLTAT